MCLGKHHPFQSRREKTRENAQILFPIVDGECSLDEYEKEILNYVVISAMFDG